MVMALGGWDRWVSCWELGCILRNNSVTEMRETWLRFQPLSIMDYYREQHYSTVISTAEVVTGDPVSQVDARAKR